MATRTNQGAIKVAESGKVKRVSRDVSINIRVSEDERDDLNRCVVLDAALHGGEANVAATVRKLIRGWCRAVEMTAASPEAQHAAKVLRKKAS